MPSLEKRHLEGVLKPLLKSHGFRKRGGTWWRHENEFIQVVNIQGSQWAKKFYINLGVYIRELGDKELPSDPDCHVRRRLEDICGPDSRILDLLNYEDFEPGDQPREVISSMLEAYGLPWLEKCSTVAGAKAEYVLPNRVMTAWQRELLENYFAQQVGSSNGG